MAADDRLRLTPAPLPAGAPDRVAACEVIIVGAGLVGLTLAIDLTLRGIDVVVLEKEDRVSDGSRSICQAQRTLEIWDRLGVGAAIRDRGVTWSRGRVFHGDRELYAFDLTDQPDARMPAFVNLQQYLVEALLHRRLAELGGTVRATHALAGLIQDADGVVAHVGTPAGDYRLHGRWLVSCEGVRSVARASLGLPLVGQRFDDRFLIADVRMRADYPTERWFWFEPPFHAGQTALMHRQADDVWRIDLQLGPDADAEVERQPARVRPRIEAMVGHRDFDFAWLSVYAFQCRTLERYVHGRVIFAGDSAHQVSPFGARGGNGGVQDADNLGWKLARVVRGDSPPVLLDSYCQERRAAAAENIGHSTRATDFMAPRTDRSRRARDTILDAARTDPFARRMVNAGRLSTPCRYAATPLSSPDQGLWPDHVPAAGAPMADMPLAAATGTHLSQAVGGDFTLLMVGAPTPASRPMPPGTRVLALDTDIAQHRAVASRHDLAAGDAILIRPDQHVAARLRGATVGSIAGAWQRATGRNAA